MKDLLESALERFLLSESSPEYLKHYTAWRKAAERPGPKGSEHISSFNRRQERIAKLKQKYEDSRAEHMKQFAKEDVSSISEGHALDGWHAFEGEKHLEGPLRARGHKAAHALATQKHPGKTIEVKRLKFVRKGDKLVGRLAEEVSSISEAKSWKDEHGHGDWSNSPHYHGVEKVHKDKASEFEKRMGDEGVEYTHKTKKWFGKDKDMVHYHFNDPGDHDTASDYCNPHRDQKEEVSSISEGKHSFKTIHSIVKNEYDTIARNPKMYTSNQVRAAYHHPKLDRKVKKKLGDHLDFHHGSTDWRNKPLVAEETLDEKMGDNNLSFMKTQKPRKDPQAPKKTHKTAKVPSASSFISRMFTAKPTKVKPISNKR